MILLQPATAASGGLFFAACGGATGVTTGAISSARRRTGLGSGAGLAASLGEVLDFARADGCLASAGLAAAAFGAARLCFFAGSCPGATTGDSMAMAKTEHSTTMRRMLAPMRFRESDCVLGRAPKRKRRDV